MRFALTPEQISTANHWYETLTQEIVATQQTKGLDHDEPYYGAIGGGMRWDFTHTPAGWRSGAFEYHTKRTIDLGPAEETRERSRFALDEAQVAKVAAWRGRPGFDGLVVSFSSTSLGGIEVVSDPATGAEINVTDFDSW